MPGVFAGLSRGTGLNRASCRRPQYSPEMRRWQGKWSKLLFFVTKICYDDAVMTLFASLCDACPVRGMRTRWRRSGGREIGE